MGSGDLFVYRSDRPEVIAAWKAACDEFEGYLERTATVLRDAGAGEFTVYRMSGWNAGIVAGIGVPFGSDAPEGWRKTGQVDDSPCDLAVPDKRTKAGKAVHLALEAIPFPGRRSARLPGMPAYILSGGMHREPGVRLLENGGAIYVKWTADPEKPSEFGRQDDVDRELWEPVPLSRYYAAVEAAEGPKPGE